MKYSICIALIGETINNKRKMLDKLKVFLGGTCNNSTWREPVMELLKSKDIEYFNPVVEDWTPECIELEEKAKVDCDLNLFVITKEMVGVYSWVEALLSSKLYKTETSLIVVTEGMDKAMLKSVKASVKLINTYISDRLDFDDDLPSATTVDTIDDLVELLDNSY